ncbi:beta-class carbonic anhydrase [Desulforamulus aeronauticus]|uniref:carbonic anhydrase n=1 Tax=Desulforamulus aeronauticus DSM 10349 TaxID=1121421 RepID=A0A1M6WJX3_9FIRM|nr:carbonic anhydrase [Desulforamulus aeronauticus]SHK94027.1 carbonic anhydrase [Desulforamulus aeronauticus DSM 10349]
MGFLREILDYNKQFVEQEEFREFQTTKYPDKKVVILTCMDARLTELLPKAMNLKNGDAKIIKNAGGLVSHPLGSIMRSILVAIYELGAEEVMVIGHHDCGMANINPDETLHKMISRGVTEQTIFTLEYSGINIRKWLRGFENVSDSVKKSVETIRKHPLMPPNVFVHGLVIDPHTGKLDVIVEGKQTEGARG